MPCGLATVKSRRGGWYSGTPYAGAVTDVRRVRAAMTFGQSLATARPSAPIIKRSNLMMSVAGVSTRHMLIQPSAD
jgi:hypothetical protein